jgi:hypothetical protein
MQFLSMKLTAASSFYDFNSETDALETLQVLPLKSFLLIIFYNYKLINLCMKKYFFIMGGEE